MKQTLGFFVCASIATCVLSFSSVPCYSNSLRNLRSVSRVPWNLHRTCRASSKPPESRRPDEDYTEFGKIVDSKMGVLNKRIQMLKEKEANPLFRLQDAVANTVEPIQSEANRILDNSRDSLPALPSSTPKWALPLAVILGLSVLAAVVQSSQSLDTASFNNLATGSL